MPSGFYIWSETAAANGTADNAINFAEGMQPAGLNDSGRMVMAVLRRWGNDISGAIATTGSSTAYTVTSHSTYDSLAHLDGQMIAFTPHTTNGATVTLNVDGLGAKPLRSAPSAELPAGVIVQGTPYVATYSNFDAAWYLHNFYGNPYSIPIGASVDFWGASAPNSSFVLAYGQAISRTTYSALFSLFSTTYGAGDGTTTFNLPDLRGRVVAGNDSMGGSAANRITVGNFGATPSFLGSFGGLESIALTTAQLAAHTHANTLSDPGHLHNGALNLGAAYNSPGGATTVAGNSTTTTSSNSTGITINNASAGSGSAHNNMQPTIIANKLIRII
ncbi:phage tail protein [Bradyrhizobium japonicum]|uniref:phage tail protein n=1 Tax=Bradyrhizobium japonicum TaxID=375 RepID=UPI0027151114|nr:tail fiber protein [Bradyrhizobium japonicum]WLB19364.1 tail fiber protein [Bradyrhizobium japonicum]